MMRIAGRGEDGKAKAIKTDASGVIVTKSGGHQFLEFSGTDIGSTAEINVENFNRVTFEVQGANPLYVIEGRDVNHAWVPLPLMTQEHILTLRKRTLTVGIYYVDVSHYNAVRILHVSSGTLGQWRATISSLPCPNPIDVQVAYQRIEGDMEVDGLFRAIEPLTDITFSSRTRDLSLENPFLDGDVIQAGQTLFGPFNRVRITEGVALLVKML